jgi:putative FmdB family regulatory protein
MPIFEFQCIACGATFEELVLSSEADVVCPACGSADIEKLFSPFAKRSCGGCGTSSGHT